ncbi:hypothetical protein HPB47_011992 [Ixodes persulcatus]|uniref:Uncharacterized protein n=1 Tax=Ixodes persulcatus TaxID=34615 RepID=A0AC60NUR4_IXOPE|nr:hypothetical protein HPB47_011992 [Ixodes persulcatus]
MDATTFYGTADIERHCRRRRKFQISAAERIFEAIADGNVSDANLSDDEVEVSDDLAPLDPNFDQPNDASTDSASRTSECDEDEDVTEAPKKRKRVTKWVKKSFDPGNVACTHVFTNIEAPYEPIEYFARYIPYSIFETLALFSNLYYLQATGTELGTTPQEMKLFWRVMMYMAMLKFLRIIMYWQQRMRIAVVADTMSLNRFFKLRLAVHVTDANCRDSKSPDKFGKARPLMGAVRKRRLEIDAAEHSSIDEQMIPFTGKVLAKQEIKSKPNREGVKVFVRC